MRSDEQDSVRARDGTPELPPPRGWPAGFAETQTDRRAALVLAGLQGITPGKLHALAWREGSASGCLAVIRAGRAGSDGDRLHARSVDPDEVLAATHALGARVVLPADEEYPGCLDQLHDPPIALFVLGRSPAEMQPGVAVVGSRRATITGLEVAREIGGGLAASGACVVSGAARGVDSAAHLGALDAAGPTLAVLAGGIDEGGRARPGTLVGRIARTGTVVCEYPPGVPSAAFRFPARNRLVVGLAEALVVVEGAKRSGTLISVDHALALGRSIYAVPGAVNNALAAVPLTLIREGATMIRGVEDLLDELGLEPGLVRPAALGELDTAESAVLAAVRGAVLPEAVAREVRLPVPEVVGVLMRLEMRGLVLSVGGRFQPRLAAVRREAEDA